MKSLALRIIPLIIVLLSPLLAVAPAQANVSLSYFELGQGSTSSQLVVRWGTETETNTAGFRIRRGTTANPAQAADIHTEPARGSATNGFDYQYIDNGLTPGQVYYYWLQEIETSGTIKELRNGQATAGGGTATPTSTVPTATPTVPTATPTTPAATSTPQPTATQPVQAPVPVPALTTGPVQVATVPAGQPAPPPTSTPPGSTPAPVESAATAPAAVPALTTVDSPPVNPDPAGTAAAETAERGEGQPPAPQDAAPTAPAVDGGNVTEAEQRDAAEMPDATPTPQLIAEAPPAPVDATQAQLVRPTATPRPDGNGSGGDDNTSNLLVIIGGGSLCGAGLLALVVFFVWRRR